MEGKPDSYKDVVMAAFKDYGITQEQLVDLGIIVNIIKYNFSGVRSLDKKY